MCYTAVNTIYLKFMINVMFMFIMFYELYLIQEPL